MTDKLAINKLLEQFTSITDIADKYGLIPMHYAQAK